MSGIEVLCVREALDLVRRHANERAESLAQADRADVGELEGMLALQSCNRFEPLLEHLQHVPGLDAERAYAALLQLAGEFSVFGITRRAPSFPPYTPEEATLCFQAVMHEIRASLVQPEPLQAVEVELQQHRYGVHVALLPETVVQGSLQLVLAARAHVPAQVLDAGLPAHLKIGPAGAISRLVNLALPGIGLVHMPGAPGLPAPLAGASCFALERQEDSELWRQLEATRLLAIHVGSEISGLRLGLWAIG